MEIIGRLTADAKVNTLKDERRVVNFSVALNEYYKPKGGGESTKITTYLECAYWINSSIATHLTKGAIVELYGRIGVNAYNGKNGEAKAILTFHVNNIKLHGKSKSDTSNAIHEPSLSGKNDHSEDLPF